MGIYDFYYKLEDKYYEFLDWLDSKGIPLYKLDDWLRDHKIPSFPIVLITSLVFLCLLVYLVLLFSGVIGAQNINVQIQFIDSKTNAYVPNLQVSLSHSGDSGAQITNSMGIVNLVVRANDNVNITVLGDTHKLNTHILKFTKDGELKVASVDSLSVLLTKEFSLYDGDLSSALFTSESLDFSISCSNSDYTKSVQSGDSGRFTLNDIPSDCGEILVESQNITSRYSVSEANIRVIVPRDESRAGRLNVSVTDGVNPISGLSVVVYSDKGVIANRGLTSESGSAIIDVLSGKYYVVVSDSTGEYTTIDSRESGLFFDNVGSNATKNVSLIVSKDSIGSIKLRVENLAGELISEGQVTFYKGAVEVGRIALIGQDVVEYRAKQMAEYSVEVDSQKYLIEVKSGLLPNGQLNKIVLKPAQDSPDLKVIVLGEDRTPVDLANVQLFKVDLTGAENPLVATKVSSQNGEVVFDRLNVGDAYFAKVSKGEFFAQTTQTILDSRRQNSVEAILRIDSGLVSVRVLDVQRKPISGVQVSFFDTQNNSLIHSANTDSLGLVSTDIRGDRKVYAKATHPNYENGFSIPTEVFVLTPTNLEIFLTPLGSDYSLSFIGAKDLEGNLIEGDTLRLLPGKKYDLTFLLSIPQGASYDEAELFFRTGDSLVDNASVLIDSLNVLNSNVIRGTKYTRSYSDDIMSKTSSNALWAQAKINPVSNGTYVANLRVTILASNAQNSAMLNFRSALKSESSYLRSPIDLELGLRFANDNKHGFYADSSALTILLGDVICKNSFCAEFEFSSSNVTGKVFDSMLLEKNGNYEFRIVNLFSTSNNVLNNVKLEVVSESNSILLTNPSLTFNGGNLISSNSGRVISTTLSSVSKGSSVRGTFGISSNTQGDSFLTVRILDSQNNPLFSHTINAKVPVGRTLNMVLVPEVVVPFIDNKMMIFVSDLDTESTISSAMVNVYLNDVLSSSGLTSLNGEYLFSLTNPSVGDNLRVDVLATGYDKSSFANLITQNLVSSTPVEAMVVVDRSLTNSVSGKFVLSNLTDLDLVVKSAKVDLGDAQRYLNFTLGNINNRAIGSDLELNYGVSLTDLGASTLEPKSFESVLILDVESKNFGKVWQSTIPLKLYIKLHDGLDTSECLSFGLNNYDETGVWNLAMFSNSEKSFEFYVENNCTFDGQGVTLYNTKLDVLWTGKNLGKFMYDGLDVKDKAIFEILPYGISTFMLSFKSNASTISDMSLAKLSLKSAFPTNNGVQELVSNFSANVVVSDLSKCVEVIGPNGVLNGLDSSNVPLTVLGVTQAGLGYNIYQNAYGMTNQNPIMPTQNYHPFYNNENGVVTYLNRGNETNASYMFNPNMAQMNPSMYDPRFANASSNIPTMADVQIKNNCRFDVSFNVRSNAQISINNPIMTLAPSESKTINVGSRGVVGNYAVNILGNFKDEPSQTIVNMPIQVVNLAAEAISDECFYIEEGNVINLDPIKVQQNVTVHVVNKCYDLGTHFGTPAIKADSVLATVSEAFRGLTTVPQDIGDVPYIGARVIGSPSVKAQENFNRTQRVAVGIYKNASIPDLFEKDIKSNNATVSALSYFDLTRQRFAFTRDVVNLDVELRVNANYGFGFQSQAQEKVLPLRIVDKVNWASLAKVAQELGMGQANSSVSSSSREYTGAKCNIDNWDSYVIPSITINDASNGIHNVTIFKEVNNTWCLGDRATATIRSGSNGSVNVTGTSTGANLTLNINGLGSSGVTVPLTVEVTSSIPEYKGKSKTFNVNLTLNPSTQSGSSASTPSASEPDLDEKMNTFCSNNYILGSGAVWAKTYFDENPLVSFTYGESNNEINCNPREENPKFCDAQQFAISIVQKMKGYTAKSSISSIEKLTDKKITVGYKTKIGDKNFVLFDLKEVLFEDDFEAVKKLSEDIVESEDTFGFNQYVKFREDVLKIVKGYGKNLTPYYFAKGDACKDSGSKDTCYIAFDALNTNSNDGSKDEEGSKLEERKFFEKYPELYSQYEVKIALDSSKLGEFDVYEKYLIANKVSIDMPESLGYTLAYLKASDYNKSIEELNTALKDSLLAIYATDLNKYKDNLKIGEIKVAGLYAIDFNSKETQRLVDVKDIKKYKDDFLYKLAVEPFEVSNNNKDYGLCVTSASSNNNYAYHMFSGTQFNPTTTPSTNGLYLHNFDDEQCIDGSKKMNLGFNTTSYKLTMNDTQISIPSMYYARSLEFTNAVGTLSFFADSSTRSHDKCKSIIPSPNMPKLVYVYCEPSVSSLTNHTNNVQVLSTTPFLLKTGTPPVQANEKENLDLQNNFAKIGLTDITNEPKDYCIKVTNKEVEAVYLPPFGS